MRRTKQGTVLTTDPSITGWGWVIIDFQGNILDVGCIKTEPQSKKLRIRKGDDDIRRVTEINEIFIPLIKSYAVKYIVSELPHGSQSASAMKMVGWVPTQMQTLADCFGIGTEWYSESDARKHLIGKRSGTKQETINAIDKIYEVPWLKSKYQNEAIADSLAVYHVAMAYSGTLKLLGDI